MDHSRKKDIFDAMLPCDHMTGSEKYQFLDLSYNDYLTIDMAKEMLEGQGILEGQEEVFLNAARDYDVNPVYLIVHTILETGRGTSDLAQGYSYGGKTVYNMYGYGAVDGNALEGGANMAYENGWFTPEAAIIGGAERIAGNHVLLYSGLSGRGQFRSGQFRRIGESDEKNGTVCRDHPSARFTVWM